MDGYASPGSYVLFKTFNMPDPYGGIKAVAVSQTTGNYVTALYGIMITAIFATFWTLLVTIALMLPCPSGELTDEERKEQRTNDHQAMHVVLKSCPADYKTSWLMLPIFKTRFKPRSRDLFIAIYSFIFIFFATAIYCGGILGGTLYPARLSIGHSAPVNASADLLFFTSLSELSAGSLETARITGVQAPSALRALGNVDAAQVVWKDIVRTEAYDIPADNSTYADDRGTFFTYAYTISGVDLGLQHAGDLSLTVNGTCQTKYEWLMPLPYDNSNISDYYILWPDEVGNLTTGVNTGPTRPPFPVAAFYVDTTPKFVNSTGDITKYAIMYGTAHRHSVTASTDPWFATELLPSTEAPYSYNEKYWVRDRRPPLACSEYSGWTYKGHHSRTADLSLIPGLPVPQVLLDVIEDNMATPILYQIGIILQQAALLSRFTYTNRVIDAGSSNLANDMQRLAWAAYVFTRNMIVDTTAAPAQRSQIDNVFLDANGSLREGSGEFVVTSSDVATISLNVLIGVPIFLVGLLILEAGCLMLPILFKSRNHTPEQSWWGYFKQRLDALRKTEFQQYIKDTLSSPSDDSPAHGQRMVPRR
ncbi:hypothetical protein RUND412_009224, partial [Rhizina undulata]